MELCRWGSVAFFFTGTAFLFLRLLGYGTPFGLLMTAAGAAGAAFLVSLIRAFQTLPDSKELTICLSALVPGGGIILSMAEGTPVPGKVPPLPPLPGIKYLKRRRHLAALGSCMIFAAGAFLLPLAPPRTPSPPGALDLKDETERLSQALDVLGRSSQEGAEKALPLQKELEETVQKADPSAPGRSYELLYELNKRLKSELGAESMRTLDLLRQTGALQSALSALDSSGKAGKHGENFSKILNELTQKDPRLAEILKKGGFDGSALTPRQLKKLADSLGEESERLRKSLQDMGKYLENAPQCSAADLRSAKEELANFIKENVPGCDDLIESLTNRDNNGEPGMQGGGGGSPDGLPGQGNPGRGRGDALLEFSGHTPEYGAKRVDKKVRSHLPGTKEESAVLGRFAVETEQKEEQYRVKGGSLRTDSGYAGFQESELHPAHRRAVKRYFEKERARP